MLFANIDMVKKNNHNNIITIIIVLNKMRFGDLKLLEKLTKCHLLIESFVIQI